MILHKYERKLAIVIAKLKTNKPLTEVDFSVLQESPFTDQGSVVDVFTDMSVWLEIKKDNRPD